MRLPGPFYADGDHIAIALPGAMALFTTRRGGYSSGPFASLNLGRFTDDDPDAVERNRNVLERTVGRPLAYGRQVHGTRVRRAAGAAVERSAAIEPGGAPSAADADGQATADPGLAPMVLTADCLPVAVAGGGAVAMLHAGWRGLAGGVIAEGVRAVTELGREQPLVAAIGPGAGPCCYEVSDDVRGAFTDHGPEVRRGRNIDLKAIARQELEQAGVTIVHDVGICTICSDASLFFSHRRDRGLTGRQAGVAWLS